jgi:hypothetical protein
MSGPDLTFTLTCADCGDKLTTTGQHRHTFEFLDWAGEQGWSAPPATQNKPVRCPKCLKK